MFKFVTKLFQTNEEKNTLETLEKTNLKTRKVSKRGTLSDSANEVINTDHFKSIQGDATEVLNTKKIKSLQYELNATARQLQDCINWGDNVGIMYFTYKISRLEEKINSLKSEIRISKYDVNISYEIKEVWPLGPPGPNFYK